MVVILQLNNSDFYFDAIRSLFQLELPAFMENFVPTIENGEELCIRMS